MRPAEPMLGVIVGPAVNDLANAGPECVRPGGRPAEAPGRPTRVSRPRVSAEYRDRSRVFCRRTRKSAARRVGRPVAAARAGGIANSNRVLGYPESRIPHLTLVGVDPAMLSTVHAARLETWRRTMPLCGGVAMLTKSGVGAVLALQSEPPLSFKSGAVRMPFPDAPKVLYGRPPLVEVTCKLCFPPVLRIEAELPTQFQERIRASFPYYHRKSAPPPTAQIPGTVTVTIGHEQSSNHPAHVFESADRNWRLNLTRDSFSLSTRLYKGWEDFRGRMGDPMRALADLYVPVFYSHVCVRYKNIIRRRVLGLDDTPWSELLRTGVSGPLGEEDVAGSVVSVYNRWLIDLPDRKGQLDATLGLALEEPKKTEKVFVIETHSFTNDQTGLSHALGRLDDLNLFAGRFFRWCITDRLHLAMGPTPKPV